MRFILLLSNGKIKAELKRRSAIEPIIGHAKLSHRLDKCRLKGHKGDEINAIFAAIGFNLRQVLNWLALIFCFCLEFLLGAVEKSSPAPKIA